MEAQFANFQLWERFCAISTIQAWPSDRSYLQNSVTDWKKSLKAKRRSSFSFSEVSTFSPCTVSSAKQQPIEINSLNPLGLFWPKSLRKPVCSWHLARFVLSLLRPVLCGRRQPGHRKPQKHTGADITTQAPVEFKWCKAHIAFACTLPTPHLTWKHSGLGCLCHWGTIRGRAGVWRRCPDRQNYVQS